MTDTPDPGLRPHRATTILVCGILGLTVCGLLGIVAWVWGNEDLATMRQGTMDPSGQSMTTAGKVCGVVSFVLHIWVIVYTIVLLVIEMT